MPTYDIMHHYGGQRAEKIIALRVKTKDEARAYARGMAERRWPKEGGYRHTWSNDAVMVFNGERHIADVAVEPLDATRSE